MSSALITGQKEKIRELIDSSDSIGIIISKNHDLDSMAAGLALYLTLIDQGKNVQIVSKKQPIVEISNLVGIDRVKGSFTGIIKTLTISVPYKGDIDKVSYNIEDDRLNVNLFAEKEGINFSEKDIQYIKRGTTPSLIVAIGVTEILELEDFGINAETKTIHIDKNPLNTIQGDVAIIDSSFSSFSEVVTNIIKELSYSSDQDAFQNLMDGIVHATRNFTSPASSPYAFDAAAFLMQQGAKRQARVFPPKEQFLNQRPKHPQNDWFSAKRSIDTRKISDTASTPNAQQTKPIQNYPTTQADDSGTSRKIEDDIGEKENPNEIPDDWFLPKVFKGGRKGN